jgi:hypothetical protein
MPGKRYSTEAAPGQPSRHPDYHTQSAAALAVIESHFYGTMQPAKALGRGLSQRRSTAARPTQPVLLCEASRQGDQ